MLSRIQESLEMIKRQFLYNLVRPPRKPNSISFRAVYSRDIVGRAIDFSSKSWEFTVVDEGPYAGQRVFLHFSDYDSEHGMALLWEGSLAAHVFVKADEALRDRFCRATLNAGGVYSVEISVSLFRREGCTDDSPYSVQDFRYLMNSKEGLPEDVVAN
jgi:hypothetical protein